MKLVPGKDVYYYQRYVFIPNGGNVKLSWAGIGYFHEKSFLFTPGINNFVRIDFMTDEVTVSDDFVN